MIVVMIFHSKQLFIQEALRISGVLVGKTQSLREKVEKDFNDIVTKLESTF